MKRILVLGIALIMSSVVMAIDGNYGLSYRSPKSVEHGTVSISSYTAVNPAYGSPSSFTELRLSSSTVAYFYTINGSSSGIATIGFPVAAGVEYKISGSTNPIWILAAPGTTATTVRKLVITH